MEADDFDESEFFRSLFTSGARVSTVQGVAVAFDDLWSRKQTVLLYPGVDVAIPSLDDLIATKLCGARQRDLADIALLEALKAKGKP